MIGQIAGAIAKAILGTIVGWLEARRAEAMQIALGRSQAKQEAANAGLMSVQYQRATEDVLARMARDDPDGYDRVRNAFRRPEPGRGRHPLSQ